MKQIIHTPSSVPSPFMRLSLLAASLALLALVPSSHAQITWDPDGAAGPQDGSGTWNTSNTNWWDGTNNIVFSSAAPVGTTDTTGYIFGAGVDGTYSVTLGSNINLTTTGAAATRFIRFNNSGYTLSAASPFSITNTGTSSSNGIIALLVDSGKTATIGNNVTISGASGTNPSVVLRGSGTLVLDSGSTVRTTNSTLSQFQIGQSSTSQTTTVQVKSGALLESSRILRIETGTLSVEGGTVNALTSASGNDGFSMGQVANYNVTTNPESYLNISSGTMTAVSTNATPRDGIRIAASTSSNGGIINLSGGTLITSNINSLAGTTGNARGIINFNGGTLQVASSASATQRGAFLTGFSNNTNKQALALVGGAKVDTNGFTDVVISSPINSGAVSDGGLTLNDSATTAGKLTLNGTNTYNGTTYAQRGTVALGASGSIASSSGIRIGTGGSFDSSAAASFTLLAATQFDLNSTAGLYTAGANALVYDGVVTLNMLTGSPAASYNLFDFGTQSGAFDSFALQGSGFSGTFGTNSFSNNGYDFVFDYSTGILTASAVPEPNVGGLLLLGLAALFFRRTAKQF